MIKAYIAENGVTIKATEHAKVGDRVTVNERQYYIVNNETIREFGDKYGYSKLITTFVTRMCCLFYGKHYLFNDVTNWDDFYKGIGNWDTSNVNNMYGMFLNTNESFNQDISKWDISKVNISLRFSEYSALEEKHNPFKRGK